MTKDDGNNQTGRRSCFFWVTPIKNDKKRQKQDLKTRLNFTLLGKTIIGICAIFRKLKTSEFTLPITIETQNINFEIKEKQNEL